MSDARGTLLKTDDLAAGCGSTYRQVDYWVRNDLIRGVERYMDRGSGSSRYFTFEDLRVAIVLAAVARLGLAGEGLRDVSDALYRMLPSMSSDGWAVVESGGVRTAPGRRSQCDVSLRLVPTDSPVTIEATSYVVAVPAKVEQS